MAGGEFKKVFLRFPEGGQRRVQLPGPFAPGGGISPEELLQFGTGDQAVPDFEIVHQVFDFVIAFGEGQAVRLADLFRRPHGPAQVREHFRGEIPIAGGDGVVPERVGEGGRITVRRIVGARIPVVGVTAALVIMNRAVRLDMAGIPAQGVAGSGEIPFLVQRHSGPDQRQGAEIGEIGDDEDVVRIGGVVDGAVGQHAVHDPFGAAANLFRVFRYGRRSGGGIVVNDGDAGTESQGKWVLPVRFRGGGGDGSFHRTDRRRMRPIFIQQSDAVGDDQTAGVFIGQQNFDPVSGGKRKFSEFPEHSRIRTGHI